MSQEWPSVSVVIPSIGRPELKRAIDSVLKQDYPGAIEVIVVFDLPEDTPSSVIQMAAGAHIVKFTGGRKKGGFARNVGVKSASGTWIAFLDDDDAWHRQKIRLQVEAALLMRSSEGLPVIGSRVCQKSPGASSSPDVTGIPARLIQPGEDIARYLFKRRRPGARRASFFTSTILAPRELCERVIWDDSLPRHQDWDWLVRVGEIENVRFLQLEEDLVEYYVGSPDSVSAGANWQGSLEWGKRALAGSDAQTIADFFSAQTLRYALQKRDWVGFRLVLAELRSVGRLPSLGPLIIGAAGLLPRVTLQKMMSKIR